MIKYLISDFSYVLLFPKSKYYSGGLNDLYSKEEEHFTDLFEFNYELFEFYNSLRDKLKVIIFTSGTVQNDKVAKEQTDKYVDNVISALEYKLKKSDNKIYISLLADLEVNPNEVIFIDDTKANLEAAESTGINCIQHLNNEQTIEDIKEILNKF